MLKKVLFVAMLLLAFQHWDDLDNYLNPLPDFAAEHDGKVLLYATSWCGYCSKARSLLEKNNIEYFEYDIEKSAEGNRQHKALGGKGIPVLLIRGEVVKGYKPKLILELAQ